MPGCISPCGCEDIMKISKNSWHARLNEYIYGVYYIRNVDCLCPYFWGTILAMFALPLWLIGRGIGYIIDHTPDNWHAPKINMSYDTKERLGNIMAYGFLIFMVSIMIIGLAMAIVEYGVIHVLFWVGVAVGFIGGIIGFIFLMSLVKGRYDDWRHDHPKEHKPNLFMEFVKAKKNKHCPMIEWDE